MKRFSFIVLVATLVLVLGCQPSTTPNTQSGAVTAAEASQSISTAYRLIVLHSVVPIKPSVLASAGIGGLRYGLMVDGIMPPQVQSPPFTNNPAQDATLLTDSVSIALAQYSSKMSPRQADDSVISSMANSVGDCHTTYFTPNQFAEQLSWIQGQTKFGGIGASLRKAKPSDPLVIWRVFSGSPAQKAGLKDGDVIHAVDGRDVTSLSVQSVVNLIRGPVGKPVQLTIERSGRSQTVTVIRGEINPPNVEYRMLPNHVGYVELYGFPENVDAQFRQAFQALSQQGAKSWVIDVRDNGGGALDSVTQVLSSFVPKGTLLFYLDDSTGKRTDYRSTGNLVVPPAPMVVLVNGGTGSGGEIFAAVLQELGLAKVVGTQTAGCVGTGQLFPLPNGGGIQITVARLVTGKGKMLNGIGVTPNVDVPMSVQDLVAGRDPQLSRALQVLQSGH